MSWLVGLILDWIYSKLVAWGLAEASQAASDSKDSTIAQSDADKLSNAKTDEDRDAAAKSINSNTFGS